MRGTENSHGAEACKATKVAVVTGASRGLGRQIAVSLGKAGYSVAVNYNESSNDAEEAARLAGKESAAIRADVGSVRDVEALEAEVRRRWGRVDAVVNNAGVAKDGLLARYAEADWDEVIRVNLTGCVNTVRAFVPLLIQSGGGHIVNISSRSSRGKIGQIAYSASKASVLGLTLTMARELAEYNIRVNAVLPGYMATRMGAKAEEAMTRAREESVIGSLSVPEEIAGFIEYLLSTRCITGQTFCLDSRI